MKWGQLEHVIKLQMQELDARLRLDAMTARQETLQMCEGMKRITLPVSTDEEVRLLMWTVPVSCMHAQAQLVS